MFAIAVMLFLLTAGLVTVLVSLFRIAGTPRNVTESLDALGDLSTERYRPMMRLLDGSDQAFLRSQSGYTPALAARLRKEHCQAFRGYLKCLQTDFQAVCWAIKTLMVQSQTDRPDLASLLLRSQVSFGLGVLQLRVRVTLYSAGIGTVSVGDLLKHFDGMQLELRSLTPAAMSSAA